MLLWQIPVLAPGSLLADQLVYPKACQLDHECIIQLLEQVGLGEVWKSWVGGDLDQHRDWEKILSAGQVQMISIARILYHR